MYFEDSLTSQTMKGALEEHTACRTQQTVLGNGEYEREKEINGYLINGC